jgi:hypothetical protein
MSLIKFTYFLYLNIFLGLVLVVAPFVTQNPFNTATVGVSIFGLIQILVGLFTKGNGLSLPQIIDARYFTLAVFLTSIFLNFAPYILNFTRATNLLWLVLGCSGISLFSLLFTNFNFLETK